MNNLIKKWKSQAKYVKFVDFLNTMSNEEIRRLQYDRTDNSIDNTDEQYSSVHSTTLCEGIVGESIDKPTNL